jgi:alpha-beta hydrolase superfamily lysophospholipase
MNGDGFTFETHIASDCYRWHYRRYPAVGPVRARVVCIHGIQSHGGWYVHSSRRLAEAGFDVYFLDRRGSGLNKRDRGDAPSFRRLLQDVAEFLEEKKREDPARKTFVVGVSWGGKTAVGVQKYRPGLIDAVALLCPGFCPRVSLTLWEKLRVVWARATRPTRLFPVPLSDPTLFTATEKWLKFLREDPLSLRQATARFLFESVVLDLYLRDVGRRMRVPVLMLLAGRDRIIDNHSTRVFVAPFAGPKELIEYPEAHHTLEFEPDPERHIRDLLAWLQWRADS